MLRLTTAGDRGVLDLSDASSVTAEARRRGILALGAPADAWVTGQAASSTTSIESLFMGCPGRSIAVAGVVLLMTISDAHVPFKALLINTIIGGVTRRPRVGVQDGRSGAARLHPDRRSQA